MIEDLDVDLSDPFTRKLLAKRFEWAIKVEHRREEGDTLELKPNYQPLEYEQILGTVERILDLVYTRQQGKRAPIARHWKTWAGQVRTDPFEGVRRCRGTRGHEPKHGTVPHRLNKDEKPKCPHRPSRNIASKSSKAAQTPT